MCIESKPLPAMPSLVSHYCSLMACFHQQTTTPSLALRRRNNSWPSGKVKKRQGKKQEDTRTCPITAAQCSCAWPWLCCCSLHACVDVCCQPRHLQSPAVQRHKKKSCSEMPFHKTACLKECCWVFFNVLCFFSQKKSLFEAFCSDLVLFSAEPTQP